MDRIKSVFSKAPLPPVALNTASEKVTATELLSDARVMPVIIGTTLLFKLTELLFCEVLASFPVTS